MYFVRFFLPPLPQICRHILSDIVIKSLKKYTFSDNKIFPKTIKFLAKTTDMFSYKDVFFEFFMYYFISGKVYLLRFKNFLINQLLNSVFSNFTALL